MNDYLIFGASGLTGNYFLNQVKKEGQKYHLFVRSLIPNEQESNQTSFSFENINDVENLISNLKISYEDYWKAANQINTSIRLTLNIKVDNKNYSKILKFENTLDEDDLVYEYYISKFDKDFTFYQIIFNSNPNNFLKIMEDKNYKFNTQNKIWILK